MISSKLKEVASYSFAHEAHIAKIPIEALGIPVIVTDEHTINMQWMYSGALGGVRLLVPNEYAQEAKKILATDFSKDLEEKSTVEQLCSSCKSENISSYTEGKKPAFLIFLLLGFPLFFYKHGVKCNECGHFTKS